MNLVYDVCLISHVHSHKCGKNDDDFEKMEPLQIQS